MKNFVRQLLMLVFELTLPLFLLLGIAVVLVQLFAALTANGPLAVGIDAALKIWAIRISCVTAFCGFFLSYLKPAKPKEGG